MKHKPFEDWIFSEELQDIEQENELNHHLQTCESCCRLQADLHVLESLFRTTLPVAPAPGFPVRWLNHHSQNNRKSNHLESIYLLLISGGAASFVFLLIIFVNFPRIRNFPHVFWEWLARAVEWLTLMEFVDGVLLTLVTTLPRLIIVPLWMGLFGLVGSAGLLWLISLRKLAYYQGHVH